ncbi:Dolichyl-diphosphooligosaccharide--protein glycosyltransferase subunit STT3B [Geodia barretti]|uniref:dolichyl-diphosphooligosaccharide--protein glycotransferase n=1 Tax=Geodia barretti TaxID=519541 RepID=A0AA35SB78_GEOBA|nr:Dolichyl-diphosphooligosaccharide--protein glycosyltransferase subunit STT3B [Geodia barretti]
MSEKEEDRERSAQAAVGAKKLKLVEDSKQRNLDVIAGAQSLLSIIILGLACVVAFASRLFAVIRFESIIHEFDPWFNYRATHYMAMNGFYNFLNWFDERAWYPLGRIVGGTVYPGLMVTSGTIHWILNSLNFPIHIRDICVFLAPMFSGLTAIACFLLTREVWNTRAGLLAACFIAIVPGYISRSVAGSYDNEGIAIFALLFTYFLWIRSVKTGSVMWATGAAISYFYMVSAWGGYVFIINLVPLHVFALLLMGRFSNRIFVAYTTFYLLGLLLSMQVPFVGFQPIRTSEHMAAAGVFLLLNALALLRYLQSSLTGRQFKTVFLAGVVLSAGAVFTGVVLLTYLGYIAPWSGRFYSLYDTGYAKIHIPIIASVSEHQPTTWTSFFFDLHILVCVFPAGIWFVMKYLTDERVFVVLYAVSAVYFAGVMVRLMLTLTPIVCILASIAISHSLDNYMKPVFSNKEEESKSSKKEEEKEEGGGGKTGSSKPEKKSKKKPGKVLYDKYAPQKARETKAVDPALHSSEFTSSTSIGSVVVLLLMMFLVLFAVHCTWVTSNAYSSPSVVLASTNHDGSRNILDDFREAYFWLRQNTPDHATVMSWWDYGYQIAGMGNRTTFVDNNTWNNSHIALVGKAMSSTEEKAIHIMRTLGVDYVLVIFGGMIGYSGDDINKFLWMVRIAEGEHPQDIKESNYFTPQGEFRVDSAGSQTLLNCLMYKLAYYRFGEVQMYNGPSGDSAHFSCDVIVYQLFVARLRQDSECGNWQQEHKAALLGRGIHVGALVGQDLPGEGRREQDREW